MGGSAVRVVVAASLDAAAVRAVAAGARVELDEGLLARVAANRDEVLAALADPARPVYGVTTGMGRMATHRLGPREQAEHQARLLTARAVGGPPWLPVPDVRALLALKLRTLLCPETGASAELCRFLADRLNDAFHPAVPGDGIGCAGEIIPLCHAFQTFLGLGTVLAAPKDSGAAPPEAGVAGSGAVEVAAAEALRGRGVAAYRPGAKEGVALIEGMPLATAHAVMRGAEAARVARWLLVAGCGSVDALGAPRSGYDPRLAPADPVLGGVLAEVARLTAGGAERDGVVQAPVSLRVIPQVHAHLDRVLTELAAVVERVTAWVTDSPAFVGGGFVSTAGYHACELGLRLDAVTAAVTHAAEASVQRTHRLLDERFSGLPAQLAAAPGQAGLVTVHKRAVGELHALRRLAAPATVGALDTSAGQEDLQAFAPAAGEQLRTALRHATAIAAAELLTAHQAHHLRAAPPAPPMTPLWTALAGLVPPVTEDRPLGTDLRALTAALDTHHLPDLSA